MMMKFKILMLFAALALAGCTTTFDSNKVDYKSKGAVVRPLEVPPDLTQITKNAQASVPVGGAANASTYAASNQTAGAAATAAGNTAVAPASLGDVRVMREGTQRWLVVNRPPEALWADVKSFWIESGFTFVIDQPNLGILETEWNENRAKIPKDGVRSFLGKVFDGIYSTNERDKYRTRLERTANAGSEIFISHRGMMEDVASTSGVQYIWKPRPVDPELEVEFLKRLMVRLGGAPEAAKIALDKPAPALVMARAKVISDGEQVSLLVNDPLDQAWRRVGLSLDRTNFTVEDRDRARGIYFVRYVEPNAQKNEPGFFARLFGSTPKESLQKYQIIVRGEAATTSTVFVVTAAGERINTADAKNILKVLADDLQ